MKITYFQNEQGDYTVDVDGIPIAFFKTIRKAKDCIRQLESLPYFFAFDDMLKALKLSLEDMKEWHQYNIYQVESFTGNEAKMQQDIADEIGKKVNLIKLAIQKTDEVR